MEQYSINLECFQGPMELLMHLIDKNKIDIYDIPIASLTEQYIEYLDRYRSFNIEITSEFIIMAATLVQIKSRMLLPRPPKSQEDEEEVDPRQELIERILEYKRFKEVSNVMEEMQQVQGRCLTREPMDIPVRHLAPRQLSLHELVEAFANVIAVRQELRLPPVLVSHEEYTIEEKMEELISKLHQRGGKMNFFAVFSGHSRSELIATFLAVLELIKLKTISVYQQNRYGEIEIAVHVEDKASAHGEAEQEEVMKREVQHG